MRMKLATMLAALALVPGGLAFASPASATSADTSLLSCPLGTQNTHYTPGLTQATRPTSFRSDGVVGACVDLSGHGIAGAAYTITGQGTAGCLESNLAPTTVINWSNGQSSTTKGTLTIQAKPNGTSVVITQSKVVSGEFVGSTVTQTIVLTSVDLLACLTPTGLTDTSGPVTLTLT